MMSRIISDKNIKKKSSFSCHSRFYLKINSRVKEQEKKIEKEKETSDQSSDEEPVSKKKKGINRPNKVEKQEKPPLENKEKLAPLKVKVTFFNDRLPMIRLKILNNKEIEILPRKWLSLKRKGLLWSRKLSFQTRVRLITLTGKTFGEEVEQLVMVLATIP